MNKLILVDLQDDYERTQSFNQLNSNKQPKRRNNNASNSNNNNTNNNQKNNKGKANNWDRSNRNRSPQRPRRDRDSPVNTNDRGHKRDQDHKDENEINSALKRCCIDDIGTTRTLAIVDRVVSNPRFKSFSLRFGDMEFTAKFE